jgi:hypothetical protein
MRRGPPLISMRYCHAKEESRLRRQFSGAF